MPINCGTRETGVLDDLESLVEASLVRRDTDGPDGPRFLMPQVLRDYAIQRLCDSGDEDVIRRRHAEYVLAVVYAGRLWKWGATAPQRARLAGLVREIRPAVAWARVREPDLHVRLCAAAGQYWIFRSVIAEAQDELRVAVDSHAGSQVDQAWVMTLLAKCLQLTGGGSEAGSLAERALMAWRGVGDEIERAIGLGIVSWVYRWLFRPRDGLEIAEEAYETLRRTSDRELVLRALIFLVHSLVEVEEVERAEALLEEAAALSGNDPVYELDAIRGDLAELHGDYTQATHNYARALAWSSRAGEAHQARMDLHGVAVNLARTGHGEAALEVIELRRIQAANTGRVGDHVQDTVMLDEAVEFARNDVNEEAEQAACARAHALPVSDIAQRALALVESSVGGFGATKEHLRD